LGVGERRESSPPPFLPSLPLVSFSYSDVVIENRTRAQTVRRSVSTSSFLYTYAAPFLALSRSNVLLRCPHRAEFASLNFFGSPSRPSLFLSPFADSQKVYRRDTLLQLHQVWKLLYVHDQGESSEDERVEEGPVQEEGIQGKFG